MESSSTHLGNVSGTGTLVSSLQIPVNSMVLFVSGHSIRTYPQRAVVYLRLVTPSWCLSVYYHMKWGTKALNHFLCHYRRNS